MILFPRTEKSGVNRFPITFVPEKVPPLGEAVSVSGESPSQDVGEDVIEILEPFNRLTVSQAVSPGQLVDPAITYL